MTLTVHTDAGRIFASFSDGETEINLESGHKIISTLLEVLQENFKNDTQYERPLMPPQANILFVLDKASARSMETYMTSRLKEAGGFADGEFRFTCKSGSGEILQRLRLEFIDGVNADTMHRLIVATDRLKKMLPVA